VQLLRVISDEQQQRKQMELSALRHIVTSQLFFIKNSDQLQNSMPNLGKVRGSCELYNSD